jgi:hypothetical protein
MSTMTTPQEGTGKNTANLTENRNECIKIYVAQV